MTVVTIIEFMNVVIGVAIVGVISMSQIMPTTYIGNRRLLVLAMLGVQLVLIILSGILLIVVEGSELANRISPYINMVTVYSNNANINIGYNVDGISAIFIGLTVVLITSCILISKRVIKKMNINFK